MNDQKKLLLELYETISMRRRPEDVAAMVLPVLRARLSLTQRLTVAAAARSGKTGLQATTMMEDFARPTGMQTQIAWASHDFLFP